MAKNKKRAGKTKAGKKKAGASQKKTAPAKKKQSSGKKKKPASKKQSAGKKKQSASKKKSPAKKKQSASKKKKSAGKTKGAGKKKQAKSGKKSAAKTKTGGKKKTGSNKQQASKSKTRSGGAKKTGTSKPSPGKRKPSAGTRATGARRTTRNKPVRGPVARPDLVLQPGGGGRQRSRSSWRTASGHQAPVSEAPRPGSPPLRMTSSKLKSQTAEQDVAISPPKRRGLLGRLLGARQPRHEIRTAQHVAGGADTAPLEAALEGFLLTLGYRRDPEAEEPGRCLFRSGDTDPQTAQRNAHRALRQALEADPGQRTFSETAQAAEDLLGALSRFPSALLEFSGLVLIRIGGRHHTHVTVRLVEED